MVTNISMLYLLILLSIVISTGQLLSHGIKTPCPFAIKIDTNYLYRGSLHFVCLQSTTSYPVVEVIQFSTNKLVARFQPDDLGTNQMASFVDDEGSLRILLATPDRHNGTSVYSIDKLGQVLKETHTINNQYVSSMSVWRLELDQQWRVAIANQPTYERHISNNNYKTSSNDDKSSLSEPKPMLTIHSWYSTYFDLDQLIHLPRDGHVNRIEPMNINGQEFLLIAMENQYAIGHHHHFHHTESPVGSLIYKLDFSQGSLNWIHFQTLDTKLALDVRSFTISHKESQQKDYYFAMLGQLAGGQQTISRTADHIEEYGLNIFKYFGNVFVRTHSLPIVGATKLDTITYDTGDSYVFIALLSGATRQISLYLFDGLSLKSLAAPTSSMILPNPQIPARTLHRRTMDSADLHLFLAPPTALNPSGSDADNNNSTNKRTLPVDNQGPPLPALALSQLYTTSLGPSTNESSLSNSGLLYHIPANELLKEDSGELNENNTDSNHSKRNFILQGGLNLLNWCHANIDKLLRDNFDHLSKQLLVLPRIDQVRPIELLGDLVIEDDLHISNLLYSDIVVDLAGQSTVNSGISDTFYGIHQAHLEIDDLKKVVDMILVDDGTPQDMYNPISFDNLIIECIGNTKYDLREHLMHQSAFSCPYINNIVTGIMNSRNITNLSAQALMTGRSMIINGDVRFEHLILRGNVEILSGINNISVDDIVFKRGRSKSVIDGHKNFLAPIFSSSHLAVGTWNNVEVNSNSVLTSSGDQHIEKNYDIGQVVIDSWDKINNNSFIENLNGLDLQIYLNQIAQSNEINEISTPLYCDEIILNGPSIFREASIAGIDISELWSKTMFKHSIQDVFAPMIFSGSVHVSYGGDIEVQGLINGLKIEPNSVLMRNVNYTLTNPIVFEGDIGVPVIHLEESLNGIPVVTNNLTRTLELGILYDGGFQVIEGYKIFNNVSLAGKTSISGTINGRLDLRHLYSLLDERRLYRFSTIHLGGATIRVAPQARIKIESVNGISANQICEIALRLTNSTISHYNRMKFEHPIHFKKLHCASINGFSNLSNTFLTRYGNQHVQGTLRLSNGVIFNTTVNIKKNLNNINIIPLADAIANTVKENRTRHKDIYGDFFVDDLIVTRINDLHLSKVFLAKSDTPQLIHAPMVFDYLDIENVLRIGKNMVTSSFNNLNITDLLTNTLQYDKPQVIHQQVQLNTLQLLPDSNFITNTLNGFNIQHLFSDAVLTDVPQQILAPKTFTNQIELSSKLFLRHGIDGLTEDELRYNLLLQTDELIEGDLEIRNEVTVKKELEVLSGLINDIDINLFVSSMLYENLPNKTGGLRVVGNGSVTFKDVRLNNLVIGGTIQGIDLSKDGLLRKDNQNGSYNDRLKEQQSFLNNQRVLEAIYASKTQLKVRNHYRGSNYTGSCFIQSCSRVIIIPPIIQTPTYDNTGIKHVWRPNWNVGLMPSSQQPPPRQPWLVQHVQPPPMQIQITHNVNPSFNVSRAQVLSQNYPIKSTNRHMSYNLHNNFSFQGDLQDHLLRAKAQAISNLSYKVNKHLSIAFYYEIVQKQPLFGPLLHASRSPISNENGGSFLFLKATGKQGEPCLRKGQTIAVMSQQRYSKAASTFAQRSRIQETSDPRVVDSITAGNNSYLFILDFLPEERLEFGSRLFFYKWDSHVGLYNLKGTISIDGFPTSMKAFAVNNIACVAIANPGVLFGNHSGAITLYCQDYPSSLFDQRVILPLMNAFELDVISVPGTSTVLIGALCQQETEQIGDLRVLNFDIVTKYSREIIVRRTVRPLKLHFFRSFANSISIHLVVSEAITGNHDAQAITRIFSLQFRPSQFSILTNVDIHEIQSFKDNQIYDIQTVKLNKDHSMLFLQSINSISIYVPNVIGNHHEGCDIQYSLLQRLPTKGANKFLVFNDEPVKSNQTGVIRPYDHFLVLSKDACELQKYSTLILKAKFKV